MRDLVGEVLIYCKAVFGTVILEPIEVALMRAKKHDPELFDFYVRRLKTQSIETMAKKIKVLAIDGGNKKE